MECDILKVAVRCFLVVAVVANWALSTHLSPKADQNVTTWIHVELETLSNRKERRTQTSLDGWVSVVVKTIRYI